MKQLNLPLLWIAIFMMVGQVLNACDESSANLNSQMDNGNGTFTYSITICNEMLGLEGIPDRFTITFNGGATVASFSPPSVSTSSGDNYTGSNSSTVVTYTLQSVFPAHSSITMCHTYTFTTNGQPSTINIATNPDYPGQECNNWQIDICTAPASPNLSSASICETDSNFDLTTLQDPSYPSGTWSGAGVTGTTFNPSSSGSFNLTFTPTASCTQAGSTTITVNAASSPNLQTATVCDTDGPLNLTTLQDGAFPNGNWSGPNVTGTNFNPNGLSGSITLTFTPTGSCVQAGQTTVTVNQASSPNLQTATVCDTDSPLNLTTLQDASFPNGTWSGPNVTGTNFNPNGLSGSVTLTFTPTGSCVQAGQTTVTVNQGGTPNLQTTTVCDADGPVSLNSLQDPSFPTGTWSGPNVTGTNFNPNGLSGSVNLTFTPDTPCSQAGMTTITVNNSSMPNLGTASLCETDGALDLTTLQDPSFPSGTWSGTGVAGTTFNPNGQNGSVSITFTPSAPCTQPATTSVTVNAASSPNLQTATVCETDGNFDLTTIQDPSFPGGTWSGPNVAGTTFNPTGQNGNVTLTYTPTGSCVQPNTTTITVNSASLPNLQTTTVCDSDGPVNLTTLQDPAFSNGTWSGPGVSGTNFNPSGQTGNVSLTFTPSAPCTQPNTTTITVNASGTPNLGSTSACETDGFVDLTSLQDPAFFNGTWSGTGVSGNNFDPTGQNGAVTLTFTPSAACSQPATTTITVTAAQTPNLGTTSACETDGFINLTTLQDPSFNNGSWSGSGVSGSNFDPTGQSGNVTLTFTPSASCTQPATTTINITASQTPNLQSTSVCETDGTINLSTLQDPSFNNGTWSGPGVSGSNFNPMGQNGSVVLTFTPSASCTQPASTTIDVTAQQTPNLGSGTTCETDGLFDLTQLQDPTFNNGTWSGPSVSGNSFDPSGQSGTVTLTFTPSTPCTAPTTTTINITSAGTPTLSSASVCELENAFDLTTLEDPSFHGGTWSGPGVNGNTFSGNGLSGSINLNFTPTGSCVQPASTTIQVTSAQMPNLGTTTACESDGVVSLATLQDPAFNNGTWSGPGVIGSNFDPIGQSGTVILSFTPNDPCTETATTSIEVTASQMPNLQSTTVCESDGIVSLATLQDPAFNNGTWSGNGVSGNNFDPFGQNGTVTLTFTPSDACTEPATTTIDVTAEQTPNLNNGTTCESDGLFDLAQLQDPAFNNGTWSGTGVNGNSFDPSGQSGTVTLTFIPSTSCTAPATTTINITSAGTPTLSSADVCELENAFDLTTLEDPSFPGGTWSGPGVNGNTFDGSGLSGSINLDFIPTGSCVQPASTTIQITSAQTPNLGTTTACESDGVVSLTTLQDPSFNNGTWSGPGVNGSNFDPFGQSGTVILSFTPNDPCTETATTSIEVTASQTPNLQSTTVCESDGMVSLATLQDPVFNNGTWSGNGVSGNNFDPTGQNGVVTLTFTPSDACTEPATTTIDVTAEQTPNLNNGTTCESDGLFDLTQLQDPSFNNGTWSGMGVSDNSFDPSGQNGTVTLTFTPADACTAPATADIIITNSGTPTLGTATICESDGLFDLTTIEDPNFPGGTWSGTGVTGTTLNPNGLTGNITLDFTPTGSCVQPASTSVEITTANTLNLGTTAVCSSEMPFSLATLQDPSFSDGEWSGEGVNGDDFDPAGLDGAIELLFSPTGTCAEPTMTTIEVTAAQTPVLATTDLCQTDASLDLTTLQDANFPNGTWSGNGVNGSSFDPNTQIGAVTLTFESDENCVETVTTTINVTPAGMPNLQPISVCEADGLVDLTALQDPAFAAGTWSGSGVNGTDFDPTEQNGSVELIFTPAADCAEPSTTLVEITAVQTPNLSEGTTCESDGLFDLIQLQDPNFSDGNWSGTGVSGTSFDPTGQGGTVEVTFTPNDACSAPATTTINITTSGVPNLTTGTTCDTDGLFDLAALEDPNLPGGNWSGIGVNGNMFDPNGLSGTIDLTFIPTGSCVEAATTTITVEQAEMPNLGSLTTCETNGLVDLSSLQDANFPMGMWSGEGVSGSDFDPTGLNGNIELTFTPSSDCSAPASTFIEVTSTIAPTLSNGSTCENDGLFDLTTLQDPAFPDGSWSGTGVSGTTFDPTGQSGSVTLTFMPTADCGEAATTTINIVSAGTPNLGTANVCEGDAAFDLTNIEDTNFQGGTWSGMGVTGSMFDPMGLSGAITLNFMPNASCVEMASTTINVNPVPTAVISGNATICEGEETALVFTLNGSGIFDVTYQDDLGQQFTLTGISDGHTEMIQPSGTTTYTLVSATDNNNGFCDATVSGTATIEVATTPVVLNLTEDCNDQDNTYTISFEIEGGDVASYDVSGMAGTLTGTTFVSNPIPSGIAYNFLVDDLNSCNPTMLEGLVDCACPTITALATVSSNYNGAAISCAGMTDGQATVNSPTGGNGPYTYLWTNGQTGETATDLTAGIHEVTVTDINGCNTTAQVELIEPDAIIGEIIADDSGCFGSDSGSIDFMDVSGGTSPYTYTIDGQNTQNEPLFANLAPNTYFAMIEDANGCSFTEEVTVAEGQEIAVELGRDTTIKLGEGVVLNPVSDASNIVTYEWSGADSLSCYDCQKPLATPTEGVTYTLTIIDDNGCVATDDITILIDKRRDVYIPNAFSPDDDGRNDGFTIYGTEQIVQIKSFSIFDRWGNVVHQAFDFQPNDVNIGWNGMYQGEKMNPAVFVYVAEIEFTDGAVELYKGDVTLIR